MMRASGLNRCYCIRRFVAESLPEGGTRKDLEGSGAHMRSPTDLALSALNSWQRGLPAQLLDLATNPSAAFPRLLTRRGALRLLAFPAASGVFVAYTAAKALAVGDVFDFATVLATVVVGGAAAGIAALWFVGSLPDWSVQKVRRRGAERAWLYNVFSYSTWPFLPLLLLVAGSDLLIHGTSAFSAARAPLPLDVVWSIRVMIGLAVAVWAAIMIAGTALVRRQSERRAAKEVGVWVVELGVATVLLAVLVTLMFRAW
jgi:hypothetical protein